jgi:hypothetical protein
MSSSWFSLGRTYARLGERSKVLEIYRHLKEVDPGTADQFFELIVLP